MKLVLQLLVISFLFSCQPNKQKADLIITNANIWAGNEDQPSAQAMAIIGDSIAVIGVERRY